MKSNTLNQEQIELLYHSIKDLYIEYKRKFDKCNQSNESLSLQLEELQNYVNYLESEVSKDSFVFSPRGVVNKNAYMQEEGKGYIINNDHVEQKQDELKKLKNQYEGSIKELSSLKSLIDILEQNLNVLFELMKKTSNSDHEKIYQVYHSFCSGNRMVISYLNNEVKESLAYVSHTTKLISSYIDSDPMRAKIELDKLDESISKLISDIEKIEISLKPYPFELSFYKEVTDLINELQSGYPKSNIKYQIKNNLNVESFINRIFIYLIIRDLILLSCNYYSEIEMDILLNEVNNCIQLSFICNDRSLFKLFQLTNRINDLIEMIKLCDSDYKLEWDDDNKKSKLIILFTE